MTVAFYIIIGNPLPLRNDANYLTTTLLEYAREKPLDDTFFILNRLTAENEVLVRQHLPAHKIIAIPFSNKTFRLFQFQDIKVSSQFKSRIDPDADR